ncbi:hypothetical protein [Aquimarina sp. MMG016]|uniref:hypothetical protein n=1 Tax=Aquimarina sp. MMG016 TaxID=2822690 RepID=UPI001B3A7173|nr:hypothetical protein [Aquimarina sp. MMG016]MBQ4820504.1 hypothetical protein [Aquimarina sp. MMG016]
MKKIKKALRRFALISLIVIAALIPVPIFFNKKEGKFNDDNDIELVQQKEDDTDAETLEMDQELKS